MRQSFPFLRTHTNVNQLLEEISEGEGAEVAVLHWEGLFIAQPNALYEELEAHIEKLYERGDWLISGQIIDWQARKGEHHFNSYSLFPITLLVNLKAWKKLGKPKWNTEPRQTELYEIERSLENVHDDYTPLFIRRKSSKKVTTALREGGEFIQKALEENLEVCNLPVEARIHQSYLYPENSEVFNRLLHAVQTGSEESLNSLSLSETEQFKKFIEQMRDQRQRSLAENSEWGHGPQSHSEQVQLPLDLHLKTPNVFYFPASSLKDFALCFGQGRALEGQFVHFSSCLEEIEFKQELISDWNGEVSALRGRHESLASYFLRHFETEERLLTQWIRYQKQQHTFVKANIITEPEKIFCVGSGIGFVNLSSLLIQRYQLLAFGTRFICKRAENILSLLENLYEFSYLDFKRIPDDVQQIYSVTEMRNYLNSLEQAPDPNLSNGDRV